MGYASWSWMCAWCGKTVEADDKPNYCPECGHRFIRDRTALLTEMRYDPEEVAGAAEYADRQPETEAEQP